MKKTITLVAAVMILSPMIAQASVTLNMGAAELQDELGNPLADGMTIALLCDVDRDGFGDLTQATDSWTADDDDVVLERGPSNSWLGAPGWSMVTDPTGEKSPIFNLVEGGVEEGDPLMLAWYNTAFVEDATGPGEEVYFGTFRTDDVINLSMINWYVPADGGLYDLNMYTESTGAGTTPNSEGMTDMQTVPEPASMVLLLAGGGALIARRRNRKTA